ncbi:MAG: fibronectin type III domain-containing protein, partial [Victivallis sp.]
AKVEGNSLQLSWKTPKDNVGVTGYILKHGVNLEHTETLTANKLSFQIDGIAKGTYQYQLTAVDAKDNESKPKNGKATIKTELPMADLNLELPDFASLSGFDSDVQAMPELMDDPLAFCHALKLDAELKLSAAEMLGQDEVNKRSGTLFAVSLLIVFSICNHFFPNRLKHFGKDFFYPSVLYRGTTSTPESAFRSTIRYHF